MPDGDIMAAGAPAGITEPIIKQVFDLPCRVITDPVSGTPLVLRLGRQLADQTVRPAT
jgi:iron complex transport system ATP-binding protein